MIIISEFIPTTRVYFCRTGIDEQNKPYFDEGSSSTNPVVEWILSNNAIVATCEQYSFQRTDGRFMLAVDASDIDYDTLMRCDTMCYRNNTAGYDELWIVCNIDEVVWVNPNNTKVFYHVDYYCTYGHLISWDDSVCFVEREHVKEDWVNNDGECPAFSNMGPAEDIRCEPDTPLYYSNIQFGGFGGDEKIVIYTPYGKDGKKANFVGGNIGSVYSGLDSIKFDNPQEAAEYLNTVAESDEADVDRISLVLNIPKIATGNRPNKLTFKVPMPWLYESKTIDQRSELCHASYVKNVNSIKYRNAKCWSSQFCKFKLSTPTGEAIDYNPQWFGSGIAETNFVCWGAEVAGGMTIVGGLEPKNITLHQGMSDFVVALTSAPQAPWVSNAYAQWKSTNALPMAGRMMNATNELIGGLGMSAIYGSALPLMGALKGASAISNYASQMLGIAGTIQQAKASGAVVNGTFNVGANGACAINIFGFQLTAYIVQPYIMGAVDDYFDVFGYRVNRLKVPERNTRKYWNFVKCHSAHVGGKQLSYTARMSIESMLDSGVTFWNGQNVMPEGSSGGVCIGDYSKENREANRAIGG